MNFLYPSRIGALDGRRTDIVPRDVGLSIDLRRAVHAGDREFGRQRAAGREK